jgi:hypothetical protein
MERKTRQENMTPQKTHNNTRGTLVESEGDKFLLTDLRRMMIRIFMELKENLQNTSMTIKRMRIKKTQEDTETNK